MTQYKYSIIYPINTYSYDTNVLKRLGEIYAGCNIYVTIMGPNTKDVLPYIDKERCKYIIEIQSSDFNYSYAVNVMLRNLINMHHQPNEIIGLSDSLIAFSVLQLENILKNIDMKKNFISIPIYVDTSNLGLNYNSDKIMVSILKRVKFIHNNPVMEKVLLPPAIITDLETLTNVENGLEEKLFTDFSRNNLIEQLQKFGLSKIESEIPGMLLSINQSPYSNERITKDKEIHKGISISKRDIMYLPSNLGIEWGNINKTKKLQVKDDSVSWKSNNFVRTIKDVKTNTKEELLEPKYNPDVKHKYGLKNDSKEIDSSPIDILSFEDKGSEKIALIVNNELKHIISATPLIKELYKKTNKLDVITDNKKLKPIQFLGNKFINNVYDMADIQKSIVKLSNYSKIIRANKCSIPILKSKSPIIDCINGTNFVDANLASVNNFNKNVLPYCSYPLSKKIYPGNAITVSVSYNTDKRNVSKDVFQSMLIKLDDLYRKIAETGHNVVMIHVENEKSFINYSEYKSKKNVFILQNVSMEETANLINQSRLTVTHEYTDFFWLSFGVHIPFIYIKDFDENIPTTEQVNTFPIPVYYPWISICKHSDNDLNNKVISRICDLM